MADFCSPDAVSAAALRIRRTVYNFAATGGLLPAEVLEQACAGLGNWRDSGLAVTALPFTGRVFRELLSETQVLLRELLGIGSDHEVLFLQGGASAQFSLLPMNLLQGRTVTSYVDSGYWSRRAMDEASRYCGVQVVASSASTGYDRVPELNPGELHSGSAYCHITANETASGVAYDQFPDSGAVPLVADMTACFLTRPVDVSRFGLIYASAQKSLAAAGLTVVIVRKDLLGSAMPETPRAFDYAVQACSGSLYNTPPLLSIYVARLMLSWLTVQGGLAEMRRRARRRSARLYGVIDGSGGVYRSAVRPADRSRVTVCFTLADKQSTRRFLDDAEREGLRHLAGHPSADGVRVSLYNPVGDEAVETLAQFMESFAERNG